MVWEEAIIHYARPLGTIAVTVRSGISKRCHEKIGDCEQSIGSININFAQRYCLVRYLVSESIRPL